MPRNDALLKARLEEERRRLREALQQRVVMAEGESLGYRNHMAEDATEVFEQTKDWTLRRDAERLLRDVERALAKFEKGTYGICERCGEQIDPARLKAIPYATLCLSCQQRLERR